MKVTKAAPTEKASAVFSLEARKREQRDRLRKELRFDRPWSTREVSDWAGISERLVLQYARDGILPARKVGGVWKFAPRKVAEFFGIDL